MIRPQFLLIYGRQSEFEGESVRIPPPERLKARMDWARESEHLRTFDSLRYSDALESEVSMSVRDNGEFAVYAIPPTFTECGDVQGCFALGDPTSAIDRSSTETQARRHSIEGLWAEQTERGRRLSKGLTDKPVAGLSPWGD
jgi:hypothetical protein